MIRQYFIQTEDPLWAIRVQADETGHGDVELIRNALAVSDFNLTNVLKPSTMGRVRDKAKMGCLRLRQSKRMAYRRVQ